MSGATSRSSTPANSEIFTISSFYSASPSRFPCLHTRMLHEQCGHVSTLTIHEDPCSRPYYGWVSIPYGASTSPIVPPKMSCEGMQNHIAIERSKCKACKAVPAPSSKTWCGKLGWGRGTKEQASVAKKGRDREVLDIGEIVKRRGEWKKVIEARMAGKEEKKLALHRARDLGMT